MTALNIAKDTYRDFVKDDCPLRAAALAYAAVFSLAPLLILALKLVTLVVDPKTANDALDTQFSGLLGPDASRAIHDMLASASNTAGHGTLSTVVALGALLLGATGAFGQLQSALNRTWEVRVDPKQGFMTTLMKRIFSFGMVLVVAFLLLISLAVSAALASFGHVIAGALSDTISKALMQAINFVVTLAVVTLIFACIFKFVPDADIGWRDVWAGAAGTAAFFTVGKFLIGLYVAHTHPGKAFGAASALAALLVWIYYSGIILLFGAEFTETLARAHGRQIGPSKGAVSIG